MTAAGERRGRDEEGDTVCVATTGDKAAVRGWTGRGDEDRRDEDDDVRDDSARGDDDEGAGPSSTEGEGWPDSSA